MELARPTSVALTVTLTSSHPARLQVPSSVTIPAGAASVAFDITTVHDPVLTGPVVVTVTPSGVARCRHAFERRGLSDGCGEHGGRAHAPTIHRREHERAGNDHARHGGSAEFLGRAQFGGMNVSRCLPRW